ncbi:hypothetical protein LSO9J_20102 [Candidatus Liberibacter solanacearum]
MQSKCNDDTTNAYIKEKCNEKIYPFYAITYCTTIYDNNTWRISYYQRNNY